MLDVDCVPECEFRHGERSEIDGVCVGCAERRTRYADEDPDLIAECLLDIATEENFY